MFIRCLLIGHSITEQTCWQIGKAVLRCKTPCNVAGLSATLRTHSTITWTALFQIIQLKFIDLWNFSGGEPLSKDAVSLRLTDNFTCFSAQLAALLNENISSVKTSLQLQQLLFCGNNFWKDFSVITGYLCFLFACVKQFAFAACVILVAVLQGEAIKKIWFLKIFVKIISDSSSYIYENMSYEGFNEILHMILPD